MKNKNNLKNILLDIDGSKRKSNPLLVLAKLKNKDMGC